MPAMNVPPDSAAAPVQGTPPDPQAGSARSWLTWVAGAMAVLALALSARFSLVGVLPEKGFPFLTFFPAVILAAFLVGFGPGLLVAVLSVASAWYFFMPPGGSFTGGTSIDEAVTVGLPVTLASSAGSGFFLNRSATTRPTRARSRLRSSNLSVASRPCARCFCCLDGEGR